MKKNEIKFDIAIKALYEERISADKELRNHLMLLKDNQSKLLDKFSSLNEQSEIERFMLAALEDSKEHNLTEINSEYSVLPDNVIEEFLSDEENE